jgi:hypothetical protein
MADAQAARIAVRDAKLAKLDWNAPRPGPPPLREGPDPIGKREAAMAPAEKREQTEIMIARLRERRAVLEARRSEATAQGTQPAGADGFVIDRLEQRVSQLEETARSLPDKQR